MSETATEPAWPDEIHRILADTDVRQVCYVPDAGHSRARVPVSSCSIRRE
jgi:hypothetical protein